MFMPSGFKVSWRKIIFISSLRRLAATPMIFLTMHTDMSWVEVSYRFKI